MFRNGLSLNPRPHIGQVARNKEKYGTNAYKKKKTKSFFKILL